MIVSNWWVGLNDFGGESAQLKVKVILPSDESNSRQPEQRVLSAVPSFLIQSTVKETKQWQMEKMKSLAQNYSDEDDY